MSPKLAELGFYKTDYQILQHQTQTDPYIAELIKDTRENNEENISSCIKRCTSFAVTCDQLERLGLELTSYKVEKGLLDGNIAGDIRQLGSGPWVLWCPKPVLENHATTLLATTGGWGLLTQKFILTELGVYLITGEFITSAWFMLMMEMSKWVQMKQVQGNMDYLMGDDTDIAVLFGL
ncbi:hypothetical protein V8F06_013890 [Rhypophila decipiens]